MQKVFFFFLRFNYSLRLCRINQEDLLDVHLAEGDRGGLPRRPAPPDDVLERAVLGVQHRRDREEVVAHDGRLPLPRARHRRHVRFSRSRLVMRHQIKSYISPIANTLIVNDKEQMCSKWNPTAVIYGKILDGTVIFFFRTEVFFFSPDHQ